MCNNNCYWYCSFDYYTCPCILFLLIITYTLHGTTSSSVVAESSTFIYALISLLGSKTTRESPGRSIQVRGDCPLDDNSIPFQGEIRSLFHSPKIQLWRCPENTSFVSNCMFHCQWLWLQVLIPRLSRWDFPLHGF